MAARKVTIIKMNDMEIDPDFPAFTTGVVCKLLDIPVWVLKQLDNEGIVSPPRKDTGKARLYSANELKTVKHCWYYMNELGVKVNGLKVILKLESGEK